MLIILASILVGIRMAALLFRIFFDNLEDLGQCIRYWLTPDFCVGSGWLTEIGLHKLFG